MISKYNLKRSRQDKHAYELDKGFSYIASKELVHE